MSGTCIICNKDLISDGESVVVKKGIKALREASKKRNDGKHAQLEGKKHVVLHLNCRTVYINKKTIVAFQNTESISQQKDVRTGEFDFKTHCFVCGECIPHDYSRTQQRLPMKDRNLVRVVTKLDMKTKVLYHAEQREDAFGKEIINRLALVNDMVAADCQYHNNCLKNLYISRQKSY